MQVTPRVPDVDGNGEFLGEKAQKSEKTPLDSNGEMKGEKLGENGPILKGFSVQKIRQNMALISDSNCEAVPQKTPISLDLALDPNNVYNERGDGTLKSDSNGELTP